MRKRMTEIQCMHMQGDNKLALLNRANILGASNIFSTHLARSIGANNKKKRELKASRLSTDDSLPGPKARIELEREDAPSAG